MDDVNGLIKCKAGANFQQLDADFFVGETENDLSKHLFRFAEVTAASFESHFWDRSRSAHNQLSIDRLGRWTRELNCWHLTCLFFPALQWTSKCLMINVESFIAASPRRTLTTALRVLGDMQDSNCVDLYSSRPDTGW